MDVYLHPALIDGGVYLAPIQYVPVRPPDSGDIDATKVPAARRVVFEGSKRVVSFEGSIRTVRF